jgi:hypothetical protein
MTERMYTKVEKAAGRVFRDQCRDYLSYLSAEDPVDYTVPAFVGHYRHACPARELRSTALECKEWYIPSAAMVVYPLSDGRLGVTNLSDVPDDQPLSAFDGEGVPAGRFGFIFRVGKCRGCGATARSRTGRLIDGWDRPPIHGRVARS